MRVEQAEDIQRWAGLDISLAGHDGVPIVPDHNDQLLRGARDSEEQSAIRPRIDPNAVPALVSVRQTSKGLPILLATTTPTPRPASQVELTNSRRYVECAKIGGQATPRSRASKVEICRRISVHRIWEHTSIELEQALDLLVRIASHVSLPSMSTCNLSARFCSRLDGARNRAKNQGVTSRPWSGYFRHKLFYRRREDLLHGQTARAAGCGNELHPAVRPDRVRHAAVRDEPLVVALLVAVIDPAAGEDAATVVLVRAGGGDARVQSPRVA